MCSNYRPARLTLSVAIVMFAWTTAPAASSASDHAGSSPDDSVATSALVVPVVFESDGSAAVEPSENAGSIEDWFEIDFSDELPLEIEADDYASILEEEGLELEEGVASYYGYELAGRPTASGEIFDPEGLTAAHPSLPIGTVVKVTNVRNGKSVVVRINDRGPFTAGRIIDLSRGAAGIIGMIRAGTASVKLHLFGH